MLFQPRPTAPTPAAAPEAAPKAVRTDGLWHILLVDDEPGDLFVWSEHLRERGCVVETAQTGAEALQRAASSFFDCVLLDVSLPGENGFSLCQDSPADLFWAKVETRIRLARSGRTQLSFAPLLLDLSRRKATLDGEELILTPTEFDLLWLLAEHTPKVYTPEELYHAVWGSRQWDGGQTVQVHMSRLRRKLEKAYSRHYFLETVWGQGYLFVPEDTKP